MKPSGVVSAKRSRFWAPSGRVRRISNGLCAPATGSVVPASKPRPKGCADLVFAQGEPFGPLSTFRLVVETVGGPDSGADQGVKVVLVV